MNNNTDLNRATELAAELNDLAGARAALCRRAVRHDGALRNAPHPSKAGNA